MSKVQNIADQLRTLGATHPGWFAKFEDLADKPERTARDVREKLQELSNLLETAPTDLAAGNIFGQLSVASEIIAARRFHPAST